MEPDIEGLVFFSYQTTRAGLWTGKCPFLTHASDRLPKEAD